jgi:hypothetical protein
MDKVELLFEVGVVTNGEESRKTKCHENQGRDVHRTLQEHREFLSDTVLRKRVK